MKLNKFVNLFVIGLVLTLAASGCRKKTVGVTEIPGSPKGQARDVGSTPPIGDQPGVKSGPGDIGDGHTSNPADLHKGWIEDATILKAETVYFDFDSSVIKSSESSKVSAVADYLKSNSVKAVRIEGNCDERGTEEYNRSLGERRALAVREELIRLGIDPTRADTISYGKDRPAVQGNDEPAWRLNRRDDFIVLSPP